MSKAVVEVDGAELDLEQIVRAHWHVLHARARQLTGSPDRALDLVQDTFERALRSPRVAMIPSDKLRIWLLIIMRNHFLSQRRVTKHCEPLDLLSETLASPVDDEPSRWQILDEVELRRAISDLREPFREVCELYANGMSYDAIARELELPIRTVGTRLFRARRLLRRVLEERLVSIEALRAARVR